MNAERSQIAPDPHSANTDASQIANSRPSSDVPLQSVLCTEELDRRLARPSDFEKENRAVRT